MDIQERINVRIQQLPTLPTVYAALSDAMANPRVTSEDVAKIISNDQASSFKVLKVANSPFYGFQGRIDTISRAILHLGFNEVRNIVLALSVLNLFSKNKTLMNFRPVDFWAHSIATGVCARMIGSAAGINDIENFFLAGILHDIGKLLLFEYFSPEYEQVLTLVEEKKIMIRQAERKVIGIDHAEAGWLLAERWKLPISIRNTIYYHHYGFVSGKPDLMVAAVHVANIVARMLELGYPGDDFVQEPNEKVWQVLNLQNDIFTKISDVMIQHYEHTVSLMLHD